MRDESTQQIIDAIINSGKLSKEEVESQIKSKMDSLGGLISEDGAAHIIANELGLNVTTTPVSETNLGKVTPGMRNVTVVVKVLKVYEVRTFGNDGQGRVGSIFVGDETGFMRVTFWNDKTKYIEHINEGDVLEIQHAYTKENNGRTELHMGNASHCVVNPQGKSVTVKERQDKPSAEKKQIAALSDEDSFVNITATIVQVYNPRFFEVCPQCNKRVRQDDAGAWICPTHEAVDPQYNYVLNVFLDDGSGNIRATFWKEQTNSLFDVSSEDFLKFKENTEALEEAKTDLLGHIINVRARVQVNQAYNNKELVVYEIEKNPQPPKHDEEQKKATLPVNKHEDSSQKSSDSKGTDVFEQAQNEERLDAGDDDSVMSIDDIGDDL
ncbi:MAG: DUF2240 family protein [Candidatus Nanoarchaeia archaeon]